MHHHQGQVGELGVFASHACTSNIRADDGAILEFFLAEIFAQNGNSAEGIDGNVEESLNGLVVNINKNDAFDAERGHVAQDVPVEDCERAPLPDVAQKMARFLVAEAFDPFFLDQEGALIGLAKTEDFNIGLRPEENMPVKVNIPVSIESAENLYGYQLVVETDIVEEVTDAPVSISTSQNIFRAEGRVSIVGEVMNSGSEPVVLWGLVSALYDASGVLMDVSYTTLGLYMEPGGISPYRLYGFNQLDLEENQELTPATYLVLAPKFATTHLESGVLTLDTDVINTNFNLTTQWFLAHGNVINNNSLGIELGSVIVSLRDPDTGKVVSAEPYWISDLGPGQSTTYTVYLPLPEGIDPTMLTLEIKATGEPMN